MVEKIIPWWRRALSYALSEIRSRFGLFTRPIQPTSLDDGSSQNSPEESLDNETLTHDATKPETLAAEPVKPAEPPARVVVAAAPPPPPTPKAEAERKPAEEPAVKPVSAPEIVGSIEEPTEPAALVEPAPVAEALPIIERPSEPATEAEPEPTPEPVVALPLKEVVQIATQPAAPDDLAESAPADEPVPVIPVELPATPVIEPVPTPEPTPPPAPASQPAPDLKPVPKAPIKLESRDNEADLSPFSVVVEQVYDGPLDLLLDLIRKQDIDIYDIPIAKITSQFLAYVNRLKASDVDVAGEFIYIASLLIHIKSKMLLPRAPTGPEEAAEDPRRELVERLLEHERFKNAAQMLQQKQMLEAATWTNPGFREFQDEVGTEPEIAADTVDLVRVFRDILERARNRPIIDVEEDSITVGQMIHFLARRLTMEDKPIALRRLLSHTHSERALIAMFLALLELVRLQAILLRQDRAFSEIFIKKHTGFDALMNEGLASARDDWR